MRPGGVKAPLARARGASNRAWRYQCSSVPSSVFIRVPLRLLRWRPTGVVRDERLALVRGAVLAADDAAGGRGDAHRAGLGAEVGAVVDRPPGLVLPLVHHLVQQCVQRLVPAVAADVAAADDDLRRLAGRGGGRVVAEAPAE